MRAELCDVNATSERRQHSNEQVTTLIGLSTAFPMSRHNAERENGGDVMREEKEHFAQADQV